MTTVDWIAVAVIAVTAISGLRRGLVAGALTLGGVVGGAVLGARLAPHVIHNGALSPYSPLIALGGAIVVGATGAGLGGWIGKWVRRTFFFVPPLKAMDVAGGFVLGALFGLAIVWILGVVALNVPGQQAARREAQSSTIVEHVVSLLPPDRLLNLLLRHDQLPSLPSIPGLFKAAQPLVPSITSTSAADAAKPSVLRVLGTACGLGVQGTGWAAGPQLVVTAAHVVAGAKGVVVETQSGRRVKARAVVFDPRNDLAVLRAAGLGAHPLEIAAPREGQTVAVLGYPRNGPLRAASGRIGTTATVAARDAYGHGPVRRAVTSVSATVSPGDSGAPAVDASGAVEATVFARSGGDPGLAYAVPSSVVRTALSHTGRFVSTHGCVK